MPIRGLLLLSCKPTVMLLFLPIKLLFQFFNIPFMKAKHLLDLEVQGLNFLVFALDLTLKSALFVHDLLVVKVAGLQELVV